MNESQKDPTTVAGWLAKAGGFYVAAGDAREKFKAGGGEARRKAEEAPTPEDRNHISDRLISEMFCEEACAEAATLALIYLLGEV